MFIYENQKASPSWISPIRNCSKFLFQEKLQFIAIKFSVTTYWWKNKESAVILLWNFCMGCNGTGKGTKWSSKGWKYIATSVPQTRTQIPTFQPAEASLYKDFKIAHGMKVRKSKHQVTELVAKGSFRKAKYFHRSKKWLDKICGINTYTCH